MLECCFWGILRCPTSPLPVPNLWQSTSIEGSQLGTPVDTVHINTSASGRSGWHQRRNSACTRPVYVNIAMEPGHRNSEFSHKKWWFSILVVILVYQMVIFFWDFVNLDHHRWKNYGTICHVCTCTVLGQVVGCAPSTEANVQHGGTCGQWKMTVLSNFTIEEFIPTND